MNDIRNIYAEASALPSGNPATVQDGFASTCALPPEDPAELADCAGEASLLPSAQSEHLSSLTDSIASFPETARIPNIRIWCDPANQSVSFHSMPIRELQLENLPNLKYFSMNYLQLERFPSLAHLPSLTSIYFYGGNISRIPDLSPLVNLQSLDFSEGVLGDINGIAKLTGLQSLYLMYNELTELPALDNLTSLKRLTVESNEIALLPNRISPRHLRKGSRFKFRQCLPLGTATGKYQRGIAAHRTKRSEGTVSLPELCAECACICGKSVAEVASEMSLPEALLLIRQDNRRQMELLRYHTQSRALANAAAWSKSALRALGRFERRLNDHHRSNIPPAERTLEQQYSQAGIPVEQTKP